MSERDDGGPAFPAHNPLYEYNPATEVSRRVEDGMSLRDWFAGQAIAGLLAGGFADTVPHDDIGGGDQAAAFAYQYADALIAERKKHGGGS